MSGRGSNDGSVRSHRSGKDRGKGRDPIYEQDAWYQGREVYRDERDRREDARYRGNAWNECTPMPRGPRRIYNTVQGDSQGGSDDQFEYEYRDQRPRRPVEADDYRPRPRQYRAEGADDQNFNMNSSGEEFHTQASEPSWIRDDRSVDTMQKRERDRLRRVVLGSTLEQSIQKLAENQTLLIQSLMHRNDDKRPEYKQQLTSIVVEKWSGGKSATAKTMV